VFRQVEPEHESLFIYTKEHESAILLVVCNFTKEKVQWDLPEKYSSFKRLFGNKNDTVVYEKTLDLQPFEAVVFSVSS
jgi:oligo-1,6-glucosidase